MATTYASSYNINFRGCSKFVSGPVFLSRKCAKACNRINFSVLQKFFSGQLHVNSLTSQFSRVAPPPVTPAWPHKSLENFQGPGKFFHRPAPGHMSHKRLNPPGPTRARRTLLGARKVFPPPCAGHMFEHAWSHKSLENFQVPGKFFHRPAWSHRSPGNFWGQTNHD